MADLKSQVQMHALAEHSFQAFKDSYPKISGKFLSEDQARKEFLKLPGSWGPLIRAAKNYSVSSIVQKRIAAGGEGVKYANNFIRDGTWKDYQTEDVIETEETMARRKAKEELISNLKNNRNKNMPDMSDDAKRLFYSLNTHWSFLRKMAVEGRDIFGPQTNCPDFKTLAAEGGRPE